MRIGLLIYGSLDTLSGGYLYDRMLVAYLREAGDSVEIVSLPWRSYPAHLTDNVSPRLLDRLRALDVDVLLQDELNHPSLAWTNRRLQRNRLPYPLVGIVHHLRSSEEQPRPLRPLYRTVERTYLRTLDGFICNSRTTWQAVTDLLGSTPGSSVVAHPAADHLPVPDRQAVAGLIRQRQDHNGPLQVLFVGNLIPRKGLHHLIDGLARLSRPTWQLDVIGEQTVDRAYTARLLGKISEEGLWTNIRIHGRVDDGTLAKAYAEADLLAVPSYEGFGIVYLEAMAFGLPVMASVTGAAREIVQHGVNGFLVEPAEPAEIANHLSGLTTNRETLAAMGRSARQRFDNHPGWEDTAGRIRDYLLNSV